MLGQPLFEKNADGRVVQLSTFLNVFPGRANSFQILFGGKVLEAMDEISGSLANMYMGQPGDISVHASEYVQFMEPIRAGESGNVVARIVLVTDRIICAYIEVWGGKFNEPDGFTRRYIGFGPCAVIGSDGKMRTNLQPYRDPSPVTLLAEKFVEFQKEMRKAILQIK